METPPTTNKDDIVMLPMMAHGHLIPFLSLAKQICHRYNNFTITIANTPLNIHYLRSTTSSSSSDLSNIHFAELPFCSTDHGLPPDTENTENLPLDQIVTIFESAKSLKYPFQDLLMGIREKEGKPPICIITDVFHGWAVDVAEKVGTVNVTFSTGGAYGTLAYCSIWQNLPHRKNGTVLEEFHPSGFPERCRFHITQLHRFLRAADGRDSWSTFMQPQISQSLKSYGMLCNTVEEIEPEATRWLKNYTNTAVWNIGPLLPPALLKRTCEKSQSDLDSDPRSSLFSHQHSGKKPGISPEECLRWLDQHDPDSILYISFGSQNTISESQMMELASGLEQSKKPFIWVIRPPVGYDLKGEFRAEWLPENFENRVVKEVNQGLLVKNWAPQLEILSHRSTGAFLSHCGWNSIMESLSQGVPMIGWPMAAEQAYNCKMLVEEMGVAVELTRGAESKISAEKVKEMVELVMGKEGKGGEMRETATTIGKKMRMAVSEKGEHKGSSIKALDDFVRLIINRENKIYNHLA